MRGGDNGDSRQSVEVAVEAIREAAEEWGRLSARMGEVATLAADQGLELSAFLVTDPATAAVTSFDLKHAYDTMHLWLVGLFQQAVTEFSNFGEALKKCADWYQATDDESAQDFDTIAKS